MESKLFSHGEAEKEAKVLEGSSENKTQFVSYCTVLLIQVLCFICCYCSKPKIRLRAVGCAGEHYSENTAWCEYNF